jgi:DHA1 family tetracycline resistance protein-like MFS transporter
MQERPSKGRVLLFVCGVIFLDAVGFGLIMPLMPVLLDDVAGLSISDGATIAGLLLTTFAVMQFV